MKSFSNILFVVTTDRDVSAVFEKAITLAENNQARLTLLGIINDTEETKKEAAIGKSELLNAMIEIRQKQCQKLIQSMPGKNLQIEIKIVVGIAFIEIIHEV